MNSQRLAIFTAIVQAGSISKAAISLGCGKSVVSRQLSRLEEDLGTRLIQRSTRRLTLTEVGELVFQESKLINRALANIEQVTGQYQQHVKGTLRVACPLPMGQRHLVPLIVEFTAMHPEIEVILMVEDRLVDMIAEHFDLAIRVSHLEDSTLVARKLADNRRVLVASPAYLARRGTPKTPADLVEHDCVVFNRAGQAYNDWHFSMGSTEMQVRVHGKIQTNNGMALAAAVCAGAGLTALDKLLVMKELATGELVEVMPHYTPRPGASIYAVYPARDWLALKTATFIDFLQERLFK